ncbi:MerR family transcriptional regulator [Noviherbaspirillum massiliense]|uniref:MerR family transcriptional regulator n=1 Tax=Noviherbaspirillum massiliense TaxID=1465823 RepID=UPI0002EA7329|nr:MerR family transcriptional regulator [Noviherbaspirillum massiliense]
MEHSGKPSSRLGIGAVERETGLSKETLRIWERRYGFPQPVRDGGDVRSYPAEQIEKLRLVKRLLDQGHRPGKILGLGIGELQALAAAAHPVREVAAGATPGEELSPYLACCRAHRRDELRQALMQALLRLGIERFVLDVLAPLTTLIGVEWANGKLAISEEHLYTESVQTVLRPAISSLQASLATDDAGPRVLLTTFPQEQHGLGLLMAEAFFTLAGAHCISLGTQTPIMEILGAAHKQQADIIALSFSTATHAGHALESLGALQSKVPQGMEIWAGGGSCHALQRRLPSGIRVLDLPSLRDAVSEWRSRHAGNR